MRRIDARRKNASAFLLRFSHPLASRRQRLSQAMERSTIQRLGRTANSLTPSERFESDVVNTYRIWLRYELFRGRLSHEDFRASESYRIDFIKMLGNTKPHLSDLM
jgi:hypothetical protein